MPGTPKILHQIWFDFTQNSNNDGANVPPKLRPMQQSWVDHHPTWKYVLWSRNKADEFLARHFAWFLPTWQSYKSDIYRVDALRYFILYWFGGAYIDIDAECHRALDELCSHPVVLIGTPNSKVWLSNYFMMAHRRHSFFQYCIDHLTDTAESGIHWANSFVSTMTMAGPAYLSWCYLRFSKNSNHMYSSEPGSGDYTITSSNMISSNTNVIKTTMSKSHHHHHIKTNQKSTSSNVNDDEEPDKEIHILHHCYFGAGRDQCIAMLKDRGEQPFADHQFHSSWGAKRRAWADIIRLLSLLIGLAMIALIIVSLRRQRQTH